MQNISENAVQKHKVFRQEKRSKKAKKIAAIIANPEMDARTKIQKKRAKIRKARSEKLVENNRRKYLQNKRLEAAFSGAVPEVKDLPRKQKKVVKKALKSQIQDFDSVITQPQKRNKKIRKNSYRLLDPVKRKLMLEMMELEAKIKASEAMLVKKKSLTRQANNENRLVCIMNNKQVKRLPLRDAKVFVEEAGWYYISKSEYKKLYIAPSNGINIIKKLGRKMTIEERKAQQQFVNPQSRRNRRLFEIKLKGEPTFSQKLKIELDDYTINSKDLVQHRISSEGKHVVKITKKVPSADWMPPRYGLGEYKPNDSLRVTKHVTLLPKRNKRAQVKLWGRTKYKDDPETLAKLKPAKKRKK